MQNGVTESSSTTRLEDVEISIDRLPPPPSPVAGMSAEVEGSEPGKGAAQSLLESPAPARKGTTLERMILSPLPPMLDDYELEYGPVSSTEPQLAPATEDGELPRFDEIDEQYDFLRRTLSHSRTRYSSRFKRPHPRSHRPTPSTERERGSYASQRRNEEDMQSSLDAPGLSRQGNNGAVGQVGRCQTFAGDHPLRQQQRKPPKQDRRSVPANQLADGELAAPTQSEITARREMYNRRYQSLQRSFRSAHRQRRDPTHNFTENLSPIESVGAISYIHVAAERRSSDSGQQANESEGATNSSTLPAEGRKNKGKGKGWFSFGRKSRQQRITQQPSSSLDNDDVLQVSLTSPDPPFSPLSPPPSMDDLEASDLDRRSRGRDMREVSVEREITRAMSEEGDMMVGNLDLEQEGREDEGESRTTAGAASIVAAIAGDTTTQNRESSSAASTEQNTATGAPVVTQRIRFGSRAGARQRNRNGADTDEETDVVLSQRSSMVSPDREVEREAAREHEKEKKERDKQKDPTSTKIKGKKRISKGLLTCPALKFITRPDLYAFLNTAGEPGEEFFANRALMELVQRIRADETLFAKYQHSRQLVQALNRFVQHDAEMPEGWEKKLNKEGRVFFIDHAHRLTSFIDPRLPLTGQSKPQTAPGTIPDSINRRRVYSTQDEIEVRSHQTTIVHSQSLPAPSEVPTEELDAGNQSSYENQVVAFFKQPDVIDKISQRYERGVRPRLREAIEDIRQNGFPALERVQLNGGTAAVELTLILSIFEEDISNLQPAPPQPPLPTVVVEDSATLARNRNAMQQRKEAFSSKLQSFKLQLARLGFAQGSRLKYNIRRGHLLEDAYEHVMKSDIRQLQRKRLNVTFRGEEGLDYGGPSREFFFLLSREIFNPYYGLFEYSANDTYTVQVNSTSSFIQNNLDWFRFGGRIIGLVIAQGFLLDVFFTRPVYKALLGRPHTLKDLESLDPAFHNSLQWILDNDPAPLDLTFTVEEEAFGQLNTQELRAGGTDEPVLEENKHDYIDLMVKWRLDRGVAEQMQSLLKGFVEVMPPSLLQSFDAQELEFLIAGTLEIDVDDWKNHTEYRNGYHANHPVVLWFWQAVEMFDNEQRLRLLQFVTGTSSVPYEGFKALRGSSGPKRFCLDYFNDIQSLPRSHTCFNRLDLPPYPSFEILFEKLRTAVEEGATFGIE